MSSPQFRGQKVESLAGERSSVYDQVMASNSHLMREEADKLRLVLKIKEGLFPDDKRLDVKVEINYPKHVPPKEVLASLSRQSGVPLSLDKKLKVRTLAFYPRTMTLREAMGMLSSYKAEWRPERKGYRLLFKPDKSRDFQK